MAWRLVNDLSGRAVRAVNPAACGSAARPAFWRTTMAAVRYFADLDVCNAYLMSQVYQCQY